MSRAPTWLRITGVLVLLCMIMLLLSAELERRSATVAADPGERQEEPRLPPLRELPAFAFHGRKAAPGDSRLELVFHAFLTDARAEPCLLDLRDVLGRAGGMARRIPREASPRLVILGPQPRDWTPGQKALFLATIEELAKRQELCVSDIVVPPGLADQLRPLLGWLRIPAKRSRS